MTRGMLSAILLGAAALWLGATPASARECTRRTGPVVPFVQVATGPMTEDCVTIEGIAVGRIVVADERARYLRETREGDPSSSGGILGLYTDEVFETPTRVRLTGRMVDCSTAGQNVRPDEIVFVTGYCHYYRGRAIRVARVARLGPATIMRLRRADAEPELGNLAPLAAGDDRERLIAAADRLFAAIKSGDRAEILALHGGGPGGARDPGEMAHTLHLLLEDPLSPFAALRAPGGARVEILGWREPLWANDEWREHARRTSDLDAIACFSVRPDADAQWPIDSRDADNVPGRPYACTRIHIGGTGADAAPVFETNQASSGVVEPN